jgi:prepilin-type N-terminal cleavage/methylation domain-containing protein
MRNHLKRSGTAKGFASQSGFALTEFLITAAILLIVSSATFRMLTEIQHAGSYQSEVQFVLNNTRIAMQTVERYIRQAGNDPLGTGIAGIAIVSAEEIQVRSDVTGSAAPGNPDKGDPDGDTADSGESITIRLNNRTRSIEIVPEGGAAQVVAGFISGLSFQYYDATGHSTATSSEVRKVGITISGTSLQPDPRTGKAFGVQINGEIQISA